MSAFQGRRGRTTARTAKPAPVRVNASRVGCENVYVCARCGGHTVTVDVDAGVTPMFLACRASGRVGDCPGRATSSGYPPGERPAHIPAASWEWYRPAEREYRRLDADSRSHVDRGGLLLRPVKAAA